MQKIGVHTIEDCLEILTGLQKHKLNFVLDQSNTTLINSIARQVFKGVALTDRQYGLVKHILVEKYKDQFNQNGIVDFDKAVTKLRKDLRQIDRSRYIKIVETKDIYNGNYAYSSENKDNLKWIEIRFPFRKSDIVLIQSIKKENSEYIHQSGTHSHYFFFNEFYLKQIGDVFFHKQFVIDDTLLELYKEIKSVEQNVTDYVSCIKDGKIYNNNNLVIDNNLDLIQIVDRHRRFGLVNYDTTLNNNLKYKIAYRTDPIYHSKPSEESIGSLIETIHTLDRYPLLVILEENKAENQIYELYDFFKNLIDISKQSVLFRQEGESEFNRFVKDKSLNNWVDFDTKIVYINSNKLPKVLLTSSWVPNAAITYNSNINRYLDVYVKENCDLIIFREEDVSPFRLSSKYYGNY